MDTNLETIAALANSLVVSTNQIQQSILYDHLTSTLKSWLDFGSPGEIEISIKRSNPHDRHLWLKVTIYSDLTYKLNIFDSDQATPGI